jgi:hypothetical protein
VSEQRRARRTTPKRTAKPCGPGTRCWCQVGGGFVSPTGSGKTVNSPTTVTRRIRRRGERGISRKTIAQGTPDASAEPVCSCAFLRTILHTRPRVQRAPGVLRSLSEGDCFCKPRATHAARRRTHVCGHVPAVIARLDRATQYAAASPSSAGFSGILDRPVIGERKRRRPSDGYAGR